jgi:hypothetical protein
MFSFVAFHERGFSVSAERFIRQLQHLNPNSIQQMAAFEHDVRGVLGNQCPLAPFPVLL